MKKSLLLPIILFCFAQVSYSQSGAVVSPNPVRHGAGAPATCVRGRLYVRDSNGHLYTSNNGACLDLIGAAGDVFGPGSSTDNAAVRFDGTGGKTLQNSLATIDDSGSVNIPTGQVYKINNVALSKGDVGLGNVDNTSDASKPVSTATQTALDLKAPLASPTLTGTPAAPTAAVNTNTTQLATTAYVIGQAYAKLASPTFTGTVTIPTPFTLGATSVTSTGTQLNYLSAATGTTGTTSTNLVFSTSPTLVTPVLGAATATSLNFSNGTLLTDDAANTLAQRNSTNAQTFNLYAVYTDASNYERLSFIAEPTFDRMTISTSQAGSGTTNKLRLQGAGRTFDLGGDGSGSNWTINASGHFIAGSDNSLDIGASGANRPRTGYFGTSLVTPLLNLNGTSISSTTGSGAAVLATSPTLVTPTLGVATASRLGINAAADANILSYINGPATPQYSLFKIAANGAGAISALTYAVDNEALGFDADFAALNWTARHTSAAVMYKGGTNADTLSFYGQTGLTSGNTFTPTYRMGLFLSSGNLKLAGTAVRGTTEGTNHLDIFDGTAPAGTLANGISLYSTSGELRVMDAAGNATLLSPHDKETNEWIFYSVNTVTGKVLRIDMERMMRDLNARLGGGYIHESNDANAVTTRMPNVGAGVSPTPSLPLPVSNIGGSQVLTPTPGATVTLTLDTSVKHVLATWTAGEAETINVSGTPQDGTMLTMLVTNDGVLGRTLTFNTGLASSAVAIGIVSKRSTVTFVASNGTFYEISRSIGF